MNDFIRNDIPPSHNRRARFATSIIALSVLLVIMLSPLVGCGDSEKPAQNTDAPSSPSQGVALTIAVADDAQLAAAIGRRTGEWQTRSNNKLTVVPCKMDELISEKPIAADIVIFPPRMLGELAARGRLTKLRSSFAKNDDYAPGDILPIAAQSGTAWAGSPIATPLGNPALALMYRRDLFERLGLKPPTTWKEYSVLVTRLADRDKLAEAPEIAELLPAADKPWHAALEPLADDWAGSMLAARSAAYVQNPNNFSTFFDIQSGKPLIGAAPWRRALTELVADAKVAKMPRLSPWEVADAFRRGECAMAIAWPRGTSNLVNNSSGVEHAETSKLEPNAKPLAISFAELPGSTERYNLVRKEWSPRGEGKQRTTLVGTMGRVAAVDARCRNVPAAMQTLGWLSGPEMGGQLASSSSETTLFRRRQAASPTTWVDTWVSAEDAARYTESMVAALDRPDWLALPAVPGVAQYMASLSAAVTACLDGKAEPDVALESASSAWSAISKQLGETKQLSAIQQMHGRGE